jgi:hypothetical protein
VSDSQVRCLIHGAGCQCPSMCDRTRAEHRHPEKAQPESRPSCHRKSTENDAEATPAGSSPDKCGIAACGEQDEASATVADAPYLPFHIAAQPAAPLPNGQASLRYDPGAGARLGSPPYPPPKA